MTDYLDSDDYDDADDDWEEPEPSNPRELVRHLRAQLKKRDDRLAEGKAAIRDLALHRAGIDVTSGLGRLFARTFSGDPTDIQQVRAEAAELGIPLAGPPVVPVPTPTTTTNPTAAPERPEPAPSSRPWAEYSRRDGVRPLT